MFKLAMTPRVGAGAPVDAILFEARLNGEARSNFEVMKRMRTDAEKTGSLTGIWTPWPKSCKTGLHPWHVPPFMAPWIPAFHRPARHPRRPRARAADCDPVAP